MDNLPFILAELVLTFGGVLAFGWWQLRDLDKEKAKREASPARDGGPEKTRPAPPV